MEIITDQDILAGCIAGDRKIQEAFVRKFSDFVYKTVLYTFKNKNITHSQSDIEDLHSTVFVKLFEKRCKKLAQYKGKNGCSLMSWIRLITVRTVLDHVRSRSDALSRKEFIVPVDVLGDVGEDAQNPLARIENAEQFQLIKEGLEALSSRDRLFLKLHFFKGLSVPETAKIIGITETNAHALKHRVVKRLKKQVDGIIERKN